MKVGIIAGADFKAETGGKDELAVEPDQREVRAFKGRDIGFGEKVLQILGGTKRPKLDFFSAAAHAHFEDCPERGRAWFDAIDKVAPLVWKNDLNLK